MFNPVFFPDVWWCLTVWFHLNHLESIWSFWYILIPCLYFDSKALQLHLHCQAVSAIAPVAPGHHSAVRPPRSEGEIRGGDVDHVVELILTESDRIWYRRYFGTVEPLNHCMSWWLSARKLRLPSNNGLNCLTIKHWCITNITIYHWHAGIRAHGILNAETSQKKNRKGIRLQQTGNWNINLSIPNYLFTLIKVMFMLCWKNASLLDVAQSATSTIENHFHTSSRWRHH